MGRSGPADSTHIECSAPRALFAELLAGAVQAIDVRPSPMAVAYLVELLDERVLGGGNALKGEQSLAAALIAARLDDGVDRIRRMRGVGDHALFVSGFLADSLSGGAVDASYYWQIGSSAYDDVVSGLRRGGESGSWSQLYGELAEHFGDYAELLAAVGDRTRPEPPRNLLAIYERYLITGSPRDRERLVRAGHLPPDLSGLGWWQ